MKPAISKKFTISFINNDDLTLVIKDIMFKFKHWGELMDIDIRPNYFNENKLESFNKKYSAAKKKLALMNRIIGIVTGKKNVSNPSEELTLSDLETREIYELNSNESILKCSDQFAKEIKQLKINNKKFNFFLWLELDYDFKALIEITYSDKLYGTGRLFAIEPESDTKKEALLRMIDAAYRLLIDVNLVEEGVQNSVSAES